MRGDPGKDYNRGHRERLRKKFMTAGMDALHDHEVLELILTYVVRQQDVKDRAKELLREFGTLKEIVDAEIEDLEKVPGIGKNSAILLKLVKEVAALYLKQKAKEKRQVSCTTELLDFCRTVMGAKKDEEFCVIYLDAQNQIIEFETIQKGIVNQAVVYPRQVLESALKKKASAIILAHNHPSGHVRPSEADIRLTKTIQETAKVLDILVHDHIIIGENRFFSFREEGLMP
ncbi:MAG: DNA repair protein RadC [Pseudomonadota bacterium]|nr:DNA repair protein RadC [Pseudomonadota bacterium]MBU1149969.1 DNA repair protein RadC [Pseudomonadota bacterium]MBU1184967.1 DNA repair protein RadC [Pseudomonadota bacterium]MBU4074948.1 DNA repair protein RadC [Pseudomonadota bacterium]MBU4121508.1 DNA repair protein RadC [Pseudomonadota bacterium]